MEDIKEVLTFSQSGDVIIVTDQEGNPYSYIDDADSLAEFMWQLQGDGFLVNTGVVIGYSDKEI